jgi:hypothetical protein
VLDEIRARGCTVKPFQIAAALMVAGISILAPPAFAAPSVSGSCAAVPMTIVERIPTVKVMIGDQGPFTFAIDTGAGGDGRISAQLAERLGLAVTGEVRAPAPGGKLSARRLFGVPSLSLGGLRFADANLVELSDTRGLTPGWDGILGIAMFEDVSLTLDYGNAALAISRRPLRSGVKVTRDHDVPVVPLEIAGKTIAAHLDTGNGAGALFLAPDIAQSLPLAGKPVEKAKARTSFGEFSIMEAPLAVPVMFGPTALPVAAIGWPSARGEGNLGSGAFGGMSLQLDLHNGLAAVSKAAAPPTCA